MNKKDEIIREAKRVEEDSLYSAKGHYFTAQRWGKVSLWFGVVAAVSSAVAGGSALTQFRHHYVIAGILSIIATVVTTILTFINPSQKAFLHQKSGDKYNALNNDARIFRNIKLDKLSDIEQIKGIEILNRRRNELNLDSPQIPIWGFKKARMGIEEGEAEYMVDENKK